jgi:hypothetical protein
MGPTEIKVVVEVGWWWFSLLLAVVLYATLRSKKVKSIGRDE